MLQYLIVLSFATFTLWCGFRYLTPININERLAFLIVFGLAFGLTVFDHHQSTILALATTGVVAVINKLLDVRIDPLEINFKKYIWSWHRRPRTTPKRTGHRIPML